MDHLLFVSTSSVLLPGQHGQLTYIDKFPSYSAASAFTKSDSGLRKLLQVNNGQEAIFLILPAKGLIFAKPAPKDKLTIKTYADLV